ncbi:MAG: S9 family peptidase [Fluviicola sp.]|jgi:dipeptidyl aminopeptidase/acylaminoacyl peptidase|nr:S9 family peptidase [Fluviicola sp.]
MKGFILLILLCVSFAGISQNVLTPDLLWKLKRLSGGTLSPDGKFVLYEVRTYDVVLNKSNNDLFIYDLKKNKSSQITNTPFSELEAQWGKNNTIWFLSTEKDGLQVWKMNVEGQEKTKISNFKDLEIEGFKIAPDESSFILIQAVKVLPTIQDKYPDLPKANARAEDDLMYRHWDKYQDFKKRHLFVYKIADNQITTQGEDLLFNEKFDGILPPHGGSEQFNYSTDCKKIVYTSKKKLGKEFAVSTNSQLYEYTIETKQTKLLTEGYKGYDVNPIFSINSKYLAWQSMAEEGHEAGKNDIILRDLSSGKDINLTKNNDVSVTDFQFHPNQKDIYYIAAHLGTKTIFKVNIETLVHTEITDETCDYVSLAITENSIIAGRQSMIAPTDLFEISLKKGKAKQLTEINKELLSKIDLPSIEKRWVETTDGKRMLVWMIFPPKFNADKKYPALLYCQGGPQSPVSQFFSYRWNFMVMASQGYVVIAPNRRGLPGFGQEWNDAISKDWGGQAMKDYLSAVDNVSTEPYIDVNRIGAVGASYGGYSVYYLAGIHNNRFKTFVAHCGLFNLESWYGTTEELFFANHDIGGAYWKPENKEFYAKNSPHNKVNQWNTPIMVIHGGMDFRVPESEGMQAFQVAQLKGLKSRYLYFPEESHWVTSPQNSLVWYREFFEWLAEDLKH